MTNRFLEALFARRGGIKFGIGRVAKAFPQIFEKKIPLYHVAGTNGKGTVVYALSHILHSNGLRTGKFVSPHLLDFNERISVNGVDITDGEVAELYKYLESNISDFDSLSFFEITFLMAWKYFEIQGCERVVIEVGLGGRLDATNVIFWPKTDIITSVGFDHMHILGDTLEKIALEKLGIVKKGDVVFIKKSDDKKFDNWLGLEAFNKGASDVITVPGDSSFPGIEIADLNGVLKENIALACAVAKKTETGIKIPSFRDFHVPGRYQRIMENVVVDVAHNLPAIEALVKTLSVKNSLVNFIYGSMRDKDIPSVLNVLGEIGGNIFTVSIDEEIRGAKAEEIVEMAPESLKLKMVSKENDNKTMEAALAESTGSGKLLVVTGSFYTVEKFLRWKNEKNNL